MKLPHMGILLTTYCNLNCRDCADLIPKRNNSIYEIDKVISDMTKLLDSVEYIDEVLLIGGETFLYKDLGKAIDFCFDNPQIGKIIITSNGTFIPREDILDKIYEKNVTIRVSGYPDFVAPKRKGLVDLLHNKGIDVEDLENMKWCNVGNTLPRNRSTNELAQVFSTCIMKDCVAMQRDGKVFFCSRQMTAYETDIYPDPICNEYVDVRNSDKLEEELKIFYSKKFISTCDYCDGISCATKELVETAIQILPVNVFLQLLGIYLGWDSYESPEVEVKEQIIPYGDYLRGISEYIELLYCIRNCYEHKTKESIEALKSSLLRFINRLSEDYNYVVDESVKDRKQTQRIVNATSFPNTITVSQTPQTFSDIIIDEHDIKNYIDSKFRLDVFAYTRLFIKSKFDRIKYDNTECVMCGLSYTQYGFLENDFPQIAINLSVTGQDMAYQIIMARHALAIRPEIKTIMMPMAYYQGFYDMAADDAEIHQMAVSRIDLPVLHESRGYVGVMYPEYMEGDYLKIYDLILDTHRLKDEY